MITTIKSFLKLILYQPLFNGLIFLVWLLPNNNVGFAIIILTVIIRLILLPSSAQAIRAQKEMQELQPEIEKIKQQYKDDQKKQAEKTMELYKANKVNPLGSCLPLLVQLPLLIILYYVFRNGLDTSHFNLLYAFTPRPEAINASFFSIDLARPSIYLAILAGLAQFWQTKQLTPKTPKISPDKKDTASRIQGMMTGQFMYIMPVFTVMIAMSLPAALSLYWSITSIFSIIQQAILLKVPFKNTKKITVSVRRKDE